jgi:hypothetical protein
VRRIAVYGGTLLASLLAGACATYPQIQEGLWDVRVQSTENPGAKKTEFGYKLCRDHAYDKQTDSLVRNNKDCKTKLESAGPNRYAAASRCTVSATVIVSKGLSIYRSGNSIHSETVATYTPPLYGKSDETLILDQQFLGSCPAGMKPGDRLLPDGRVAHPR